MFYIYSDQINQLIMSSMYNVNHHEKHVYTRGYPGIGSSPSPGTPTNLTSQQLTQLKSQIAGPAAAARFITIHTVYTDYLILLRSVEEW